MSSRFSMLRFILLSLLSIYIGNSWADGPYHIPVYTGTPFMIATGVVTQQNLSAALRSGSSKAGKSTVAQPPAGPQWLVVGTEPAGVPEKLANQLAPSVRGTAKVFYQGLLDKHPSLMKQLGVRSDDVACGVATFLAGSYAAYNDIDFPDRLFVPLYEQTRKSIAANPKFADTPMPERREMFEHMVIIGTFLAVTHELIKHKPDPNIRAQMKMAAKTYIEKFLKLDVARLRLTDQGLVLAKK